MTPETKAWVARAIGRRARVTWWRRLLGGATSDLWAVTVRAPTGSLTRLVLKQPLPEIWGGRPGRLAAVEAAALEAARRIGVPTPQVVALDAGEDADGGAGRPSLLITRLPGRVHLAYDDRRRWIDGLAETVATVHEAGTRGVTGVWRWSRPTWPLERALPRWTKHPGAWAEARALAASPPPAAGRVFAHGDFHPGNVLWRRGSVSGLVDWQGGMLGPREVDLAHCRTNLALLYGRRTADDFLGAYRAITGLYDDEARQPWFDAIDVLGFAPEPFAVWDWNGFGRPDLTRDLLRRRLDEHVDAVARASRT